MLTLSLMQRTGSSKAVLDLWNIGDALIPLSGLDHSSHKPANDQLAVPLSVT